VVVVAARSVCGSRTRVPPVGIENTILERERKLVRERKLHIIDFLTVQHNKINIKEKINIVCGICRTEEDGIEEDPMEKDTYE